MSEQLNQKRSSTLKRGERVVPPTRVPEWIAPHARRTLEASGSPAADEVLGKLRAFMEEAADTVGEREDERASFAAHARLVRIEELLEAAHGSPDLKCPSCGKELTSERSVVIFHARPRGMSYSSWLASVAVQDIACRSCSREHAASTDKRTKRGWKSVFRRDNLVAVVNAAVASRIRAAAGMTRAEFAAATGLSYASVRRIDDGQRVHVTKEQATALVRTAQLHLGTDPGVLGK